jgi:hypothetical protein
MTEAPRPDQAASNDNRRRIHRHRSLIGAQIIFRNGFCSMGAQILNTSDTGALLKPADPVGCPAKFALKPRFESARDCEVMWRRGEILGVRYV